MMDDGEFLNACERMASHPHPSPTAPDIARLYALAGYPRLARFWNTADLDSYFMERVTIISLVAEAREHAVNTPLRGDFW